MFCSRKNLKLLRNLFLILENIIKLKRFINLLICSFYLLFKFKIVIHHFNLKNNNLSQK